MENCFGCAEIVPVDTSDNAITGMRGEQMTAEAMTVDESLRVRVDCVLA